MDIIKNNADSKTEKDRSAGKKQNGAKLSVGYYRLFMFLTSAIRIIYRGRARLSEAFRKQKKEGPMLILCNHVSALDFVHMTPPMRGAKVNFVVAEHMKYSQPVFSKLIVNYGAIQKKAFYADFQCIKSIKQNLDAGISVILCPEGKVSSDGVTGEITASTARLVKWLNYPVASMIINGAGLVRPKWAHSGRHGKVLTVCDMLFTADEVKTRSKEELLPEIRAALAHNEHLYQRENRLTYHGAGLAEGLENLLYRCPKCGREFKMSAYDNFIKCGVCGNSAYYTKTGELLPLSQNDVCPDRIDIWYDNQRTVVKEEIENGSFGLAYPVELYIENEKQNGYRPVIIGTLSMDLENITFAPDFHASQADTANAQAVKDEMNLQSGKINAKSDNSNAQSGEIKARGSNAQLSEANGKHESLQSSEVCEKPSGTDARETLTFPVKNYSAITNIPGSSVDFYDEKHVYRFKFLAEQASEKYAIAVEVMGKLREK